MPRKVVYLVLQLVRLSDGHALLEQLAQGRPRDAAQEPVIEAWVR